MKEHERINRLLVDFALGELPPQAEVEGTTHLSECLRCLSTVKRLETLLECTGRMGELSADNQICESAKQAVLKAVESEKMKTTSGLIVGLEFKWRTIMNGKKTRFAAAAVVVFVVLSGITFWPGGNSENGHGWNWSTFGRTAKNQPSSRIVFNGIRSFPPIHSSRTFQPISP